MKKLLCLIALIALLGCGKSNPTSPTSQQPEAELTTLAVAVDSGHSYGNQKDIYYSLRFNTNKGRVCTIHLVELEYPWISGGQATARDDNPPTTIVNGQSAVGKFNGLYTRTGNYTLTVTASWEGWSGVKTSSGHW